MKVLNVIKNIVFGANIFALALVLLVCSSQSAFAPSFVVKSGQCVAIAAERYIDNTPFMVDFSTKMRKVGEYEATERYKHNPELLLQEGRKKG